jgi:hypothetical protein
MSTQYKYDRCGQVFSKFVRDGEPSVPLCRGKKVDLCRSCLIKLEYMHHQFMNVDDLLPPLTPPKQKQRRVN